MADEVQVQQAAPEVQQDPWRRLRMTLRIVLVLLLVGMGVLAYAATQILQPRGAPKQSVTAGMEWVRSIYGFGPAADQQLLGPTSVAVAPNGDIYANDPQRARVMRFAPNGTFKSLVHTGGGGTGKGQFLRPGGLATDADGNLYIADPFAGKIIVFGDDGAYRREWPASGPKGISIRGDAVYVLSTGKVTVFDTFGKDRGSFGRRGREAGEIDAFQGIVADGARIYIADALNRRLEAFDMTGELVWASPGGSANASGAVGSSAGTTEAAKVSTSAADVYGLPQDLVLDGAGRLAVIDAFQFQIIVADPKDGRVLGRYGDFGEDDGLFFYPTGIDYDAQRDWFVVADTRNDRVQIVRIPGSGGTPVAAAQRFLAWPFVYCALPLGLALLALVAALLARRGARRRQMAAELL
ncbi:MAG: hypothetical protein Q7W16_07260 [Coriobacteriia bacterium]|nr:hypothetical protein [Coriobacteriia bacterium]